MTESPARRSALLPYYRSRHRIARRLAVLAASALFVAACGGGGDDTSTAQNVGGGGTNQAPAISGTPAASVTQNTAYAFTPTATDANGDTLTFSISGKPSWATFNTTTGALTGTPTTVASYSNIQISVSDGTTSTALAAFSINVVGTSTGAVTLNWTPPSTNTDGSAYTNPNGYRVYWGTQQNNYQNFRSFVGAGSPSSAVIDQLTPGTWYFVVTAIDTAGNESAYSNVATKTI